MECLVGAILAIYNAKIADEFFVCRVNVNILEIGSILLEAEIILLAK